jgi:hypothetical protein
MPWVASPFACSLDIRHLRRTSLNRTNVHQFQRFHVMMAGCELP